MTFERALMSDANKSMRVTKVMTVNLPKYRDAD
jgi:hypothetical protein